MYVTGSILSFVHIPCSDDNLQNEGSKKFISSSSQGSKPSTIFPSTSQAGTTPAASELPLPLMDLQAPLAELVRPSSIEEFVGQESVVGRNAILRSILETGLVPSLIFWGPPGCGKVSSLYEMFLVQLHEM